jgi:hypothetical protein
MPQRSTRACSTSKPTRVALGATGPRDQINCFNTEGANGAGYSTPVIEHNFEGERWAPTGTDPTADANAPLTLWVAHRLPPHSLFDQRYDRGPKHPTVGAECDYLLAGDGGRVALSRLSWRAALLSRYGHLQRQEQRVVGRRGASGLCSAVSFLCRHEGRVH